MTKEVRQFLKKLEKLGLQVEQTRGHHYRITRDGIFLGIMPGTPSDRRALLNKRAELRRAGVPL